MQGVGFRPFVYRSALRCDIRGRVFNSSGGVVIEAEGGHTGLSRFLSILETELPPLARIDERVVSWEQVLREVATAHSQSNTA